MGLLSRKKKSETGSTLSSTTLSTQRDSLPLSQRSDYSFVSDEKIYNPSGQPIPSPMSDKSARTQVKQLDEYPSPPVSTVNVYVNTNSPSTKPTTRTTYSTFKPEKLTQQPVPKHCGVPCARKITRSSNRNGNAGRPYYICVDCKKFVTWDDKIGQREDHPKCDCGEASRLQITGVDKGRKFFYKCYTGECEFFEWKLKDDGSHVAVKEDVADALRDLGIA